MTKWMTNDSSVEWRMIRVWNVFSWFRYFTFGLFYIRVFLARPMLLNPSGVSKSGFFIPLNTSSKPTLKGFQTLWGFKSKFLHSFILSFLHFPCLVSQFRAKKFYVSMWRSSVVALCICGALLRHTFVFWLIFICESDRIKIRLIEVAKSLILS